MARPRGAHPLDPAWDEPEPDEDDEEHEPDYEAIFNDRRASRHREYDAYDS